MSINDDYDDDDDEYRPTDRRPLRCKERHANKEERLISGRINTAVRGNVIQYC